MCTGRSDAAEDVDFKASLGFIQGICNGAKAADPAYSNIFKDSSGLQVDVEDGFEVGGKQYG